MKKVIIGFHRKKYDVNELNKFNGDTLFQLMKQDEMGNNTCLFEHKRFFRELRLGTIDLENYAFYDIEYDDF